MAKKKNRRHAAAAVSAVLSLYPLATPWQHPSKIMSFSQSCLFTSVTIVTFAALPQMICYVISGAVMKTILHFWCTVTCADCLLKNGKLEGSIFSEVTRILLLQVIYVLMQMNNYSYQLKHIVAAGCSVSTDNSAAASAAYSQDECTECMQDYEEPLTKLSADAEKRCSA